MRREIEKGKMKASGHLEDAFLRKNSIPMSAETFAEHKKEEHRYVRRVEKQKIKNVMMEK